MKKAVILLFVFALLTGALMGIYHLDGISNGDGTVHVELRGEVDNMAEENVKLAASKFNDVMYEAADARLNKDVRAILTASSRDYKQALKKEFNMDDAEAEKVAAVSGGWTSGTGRITLLNGSAGTMGDKTLQYSTTGHELYHQLQAEMSDGHDTDKTAYFWLEEGSADLAGAFLADKLGAQKLQKWKLDRLHEYGSVYSHIRIDNLYNADAKSRLDAMDKNMHSYLLSDLMVIFLMEPYEGKELSKMTEYYKALANYDGDGDKAFFETFGISGEDFKREFMSWLSRKKSISARLDIIPAKGAEQISDNLLIHMNAVRAYIKNAFGTDLQGEYQIIVTNDSDGFRAALRDVLAIDNNKADNLAGKSLWVESGSTVFVDGGQLHEKDQQIFSMAALMIRMMEGRMASEHVTELEWLGRGAAYYVGIEMLIRNGYGIMPQYVDAWKQRLESSGTPSLSTMRTSDGWNKVAEQYGQEAASDAAQLAVYRLVKRYGTASLYRWFRETGRMESASKAFEKVFGMTVEAYERSAL